MIYLIIFNNNINQEYIHIISKPLQHYPNGLSFPLYLFVLLCEIGPGLKMGISGLWSNSDIQTVKHVLWETDDSHTLNIKCSPRRVKGML